VQGELGISLGGVEEAVGTLDFFSSIFENMVGVWPIVRDALRSREAQTFREHGPAWVPLSPAYASWKEMHYPGMPILEMTEDLRRSLTEGSEYEIYEPTPFYMTWGTSLPYAYDLNKGDPPLMGPRQILPSEAADEALALATEDIGRVFEEVWIVGESL
jgi:hypothetical protein